LLRYGEETTKRTLTKSTQIKAEREGQGLNMTTTCVISGNKDRPKNRDVLEKQIKDYDARINIRAISPESETVLVHTTLPPESGMIDARAP
jgi:hypothetical protein